MTLNELLATKTNCKICGKICTVTFDFMANVKGYFGKYSGRKRIRNLVWKVNGNDFFLAEKTDYGITATTRIVNLDTCKYKCILNEGIKDFADDPHSLEARFDCFEHHADFLSDDDSVGIKKDRHTKSYTTTSEDENIVAGHYSAMYRAEIKNTIVCGFNIETEILESTDFSIFIDWRKNKTSIERRKKTVELSFVLDKDINSLDFDSLVKNLGLLK